MRGLSAFGQKRTLRWDVQPVTTILQGGERGVQFAPRPHCGSTLVVASRFRLSSELKHHFDAKSALLRRGQVDGLIRRKVKEPWTREIRATGSR